MFGREIGFCLEYSYPMRSGLGTVQWKTVRWLKNTVLKGIWKKGRKALLMRCTSGYSLVDHRRN